MTTFQTGPAANDNHEPDDGLNCNGINGTPFFAFCSGPTDGDDAPELTFIE